MRSLKRLQWLCCSLPCAPFHRGGPRNGQAPEADGDCVAYRWYADKRSVRYDTSREPIPCKSHPDGNAFRLYTSLRCFIRAMLKNFVLGTTKLAKKESRYKKKINYFINKISTLLHRFINMRMRKIPPSRLFRAGSRWVIHNPAS